jgi:hypothetical protein
MNRRFTCLVLLAAAALAGGCAHRPGHASMAAFRAEPPVLSLGSGDALGRAVYMNDLVIAARDLPSEIVLTGVPDQMPIE